MRKILLFSFFIILSKLSFSQEPLKDAIMIDSVKISNVLAEWRIGVLNQTFLSTDPRGNVLIQMAFARNPTDAPIPGTYTLANGNKATVKKGEQIIRLNYGLKYISTEESGTVTITYQNELFTFDMKDVVLVDKKTKEKHILSANITMFIARKE